MNFLQRLKQRRLVPWAVAYIAAAFALLEKARPQQDIGLVGIAISPLFDNLRKDPRWLPLLRKLGKAPEQLDRIAFKVTLPKQTQSGAGQP